MEECLNGVESDEDDGILLGTWRGFIAVFILTIRPFSPDS